MQSQRAAMGVVGRCRVAATSFAAGLNRLAGLGPLAVLSPLVGIAASLAGALAVLFVSPDASGQVLNESAKLSASDAAQADEFGHSVSVSGDVAVVGARQDDDRGDRSGSAYVFRWNGSSWVQEQKLVASDGAEDDEFGYSVSVSGDVAVVGTDDAWDGLDWRPGSAYVFRWNGSSWAQEQKLLPSDGVPDGCFGQAVSVSGNVIVVGAKGDTEMGSWSGAAYVFRWNGSMWVQEQKLLASDGAANDQAGNSVSVSGDIAVVGAHYGDDVVNNSGWAYVYRWNGSLWLEEQKLLASDAAQADEFGHSVSVSGDVAVVGARQDDDRGDRSGSAYVFRWNGSSWVQEQKLLASDGEAEDEFGSSVSVSGNVAVIGTPGVRYGPIPGSAYVFHWNGSSWVQGQKLMASDGEASNQLGFSVSVSGEVAIAGAYHDNDDGTHSGSAYMFVASPPPDCSGVNNCSGHGTCVGNDVCACDAGWTGSDCSTPACGDGIPDPGEECDDGNTADCDGCRGDCSAIEGTCGDGTLDTLCEACDDGYTDACGSCSADCTGAGTGSACGDGELCPETEPCDDGGESPTCDADCTPVSCGDGTLNVTAGEQCDDGYTDDCGSCNADCTGPGIAPSAPPEAERLPAAGPVNAKNRFVSIKTVDAGRDQAIRVRFVDLPSPFDVWQHGHPQRVGPGDYFVGTPREVCENSGQGLDVPAVDCSIFAGPTRTFWAAPLLCDKGAAHYMDWRGQCDAGTCVGGLNDGQVCLVHDDCVEVIHLYHAGLVPSGVYDVQVIDINCALQDEGSYSAPLRMIQSAWGDVCGPGPGGACSSVADGTVDVANDVLGVLDKVANVNHLQKARADIAPAIPDFIVDVPNDVLHCLEAFTGGEYPFAPGDPCAPGLSREGD